MKKFILNNLWWVVLIVALLMLVLHSIPGIKLNIDNTSIVLLIVIFLSPFVLALKKIKFGEFEAEIDPEEIRKIQSEYKEALPDTKSAPPEKLEIENTIKSIVDLVNTDPVVALAKLRIELEKILNKIFRLTQTLETRNKNLPLGKIIQILNNQELLPQNISGPIREVIAICNRAIHGEDIREKDAKAIVDIGTSILDNLFWHSRMNLFEPIEKFDISNNEIDIYSNAKYKVTTIVPVLDEPYKNIRILTQEGLDELLDGYNEIAEFIIEVTKVED